MSDSRPGLSGVPGCDPGAVRRLPADGQAVRASRAGRPPLPRRAPAPVPGPEAVPVHHPGTGCRRPTARPAPGPGSAAAAELSAHAARAGTLRPGLVLIGDKGFARRDFDKPPRSERAVSLARPDRRDEAPRHGPAGRIRQWTGPVNDTLNRQPGLEHHGGRTTGGLHARIAQRTPAMATRTRHNRYRRARQTIADRQRPPNP